MDKPQSVCPSPATIRNWLDERGDLSHVDLLHIENCPTCGQLLDQLSDAPDLRESANWQEAPPRGFEHEPEFLQVVGQLKHLDELVAVDVSTGVSPAGVTQPDTSQEDLGQKPNLLEAIELQESLPDARYEVQRLIAAGGTSAVYLAYDKQLAQDVAIKVLWREHTRDRQRFLREAKILAEIDSPYVVRIFDLDSLTRPGAGQGAGTASPQNILYIVMEFVPGGTARDLIEHVGQFRDFHSLASLFATAARGLCAAHARNLVHRDIKPTNLLLKSTRDAFKVADFGLARFDEEDVSQVTRTGDIVGTPQFMSPEQVDASQQITASTDIYSLGVSLYVVLTGRNPFRGNTAAILRQIPLAEAIAPRILEPGIPADLETICLKAMQKEVGERYHSMASFAADLEAFAQRQPISARPVSATTRAIRFLKGNLPFTTTLAVAVLIGLTLVVGSLAAATILRGKNRQLETALTGERTAKAEAEQAFRSSLDAADQLLISVARDTQWLPQTPGSQKVSRRLLERARDYLASFVANNQEDATLSFQMARAHAGLADIASRLGEPDKVQAESELTLQLIDQVEAMRNSDDRTTGVQVEYQKLALLRAETQLTYGNYLQESGSVQSAIELLQDSIAQCDLGLQQAAGDEALLSCKALALRGLADAEIAIGNENAAADWLEQSRFIFTDLNARFPGQTEYQRDFALVQMTLATTAIDRGELTEGKEYLHEALQMLAAVDPQAAGALRVAELRGVIHTNLGLAERRLGNTEQAKAAYDLAIAEHQRLIQLEPFVASHKWNLVTATLNSGGPELDMGNLEPLVLRWRSIVPVLDDLIAQEPDTVRYQQVKAMLQSNIAIILRDLGKLEEAIEPLKAATSILIAQSARLNNAPEAFLPVALNHYELATTYIELEQFPDAENALDLSDQVVAELLAEHPEFTPARGHKLDVMLARFILLTAQEHPKWNIVLQQTEDTLNLARELASQQPDVMDYQLKLPAALINRGQAYLALEDLGHAQDDARDAASQLELKFEAPYSDGVRALLQKTQLLQAEILAHELQADSDPALQNSRRSMLRELIEQARSNGASTQDVAPLEAILVELE